jgi:flagellar export protein FliJ
MKDHLKENLRRLDRLVRIRQTHASVAEASVKQTQGEVRRLEAADHETAGNIQDTQAEIAYLQTSTGQDVQSRERYIQALEHQRKLIQQSLVKAMDNFEQRRHEWTEAMREERLAEKLQERRLHQWQREDDVAQQKLRDDTSIVRAATNKRGYRRA